MTIPFRECASKCINTQILKSQHESQMCTEYSLSYLQCPGGVHLNFGNRRPKKVLLFTEYLRILRMCQPAAKASRDTNKVLSQFHVDLMHVQLSLKQADWFNGVPDYGPV